MGEAATLLTGLEELLVPVALRLQILDKPRESKGNCGLHSSHLHVQAQICIPLSLAESVLGGQ